MDEYWNHNTAYHPWLKSIAARRHGTVLDVGCGDGFLIQRLADVSQHVTGIDPDEMCVQRSVRRIQGLPNVAVECRDLADFASTGDRFDVITFVASIHHQPLRAALTTARRLLAPGGELAIVGLSANASVVDWVWSAATTPISLIGSRLHHETPDIGVPMCNPRESLGEIRRTARDVLPHARIRRGVYYRYRLHWRNA